jgi:CarD family transcriptional regulator
MRQLWNSAEYYVLQPAFNNNMTIKTPVNNRKVLMREIITKDDALSLIESMPETETVWINNNRERNENFKAALKTGESEEWAKLIKTLYLEKQEKSEHGKNWIWEMQTL